MRILSGWDVKKVERNILKIKLNKKERKDD